MGMEVSYCLENLIDNKFGIEFIQSVRMHAKDEVVEVATAKKTFENDY